MLYCLSYILYVNILFLPVQLFQCVGHIGEDRGIFSKAVLFQRKSSLKFVPHVSIWMCGVNSFGFSLVISLQLEIQTGLSCYKMLRHDLKRKLMFLALEGMSLLTSIRRCRGVVALEPLPEVAGALKRSLQMNGWEEKSQVRPGVLSSKCCVIIWKT